MSKVLGYGLPEDLLEEFKRTGTIGGHQVG